MSKLKGICPLCQEEIKESEKEYRFRWDGEDYIVHDKCAHPKNEQLDRIERMLKWAVFAIQSEFHFKQMSNIQKEKLKQLIKNCPDISDILEEKK